MCVFQYATGKKWNFINQKFQCVTNTHLFQQQYWIEWILGVVDFYGWSLFSFTSASCRSEARIFMNWAKWKRESILLIEEDMAHSYFASYSHLLTLSIIKSFYPILCLLGVCLLPPASCCRDATICCAFSHMCDWLESDLENGLCCRELHRQTLRRLIWESVDS